MTHGKLWSVLAGASYLSLLAACSASDAGQSTDSLMGTGGSSAVPGTSGGPGGASGGAGNAQGGVTTDGATGGTNASSGSGGMPPPGDGGGGSSTGPIGPPVGSGGAMTNPLLSCDGRGGDTDTPLIHDMENGSGSFLETSAGRLGSWFVFNDGTPGGVQTPPAGPGAVLMTEIPGGRGDSQFALHTTGVGFSDYGAGVGVILAQGDGTQCPYDASGYTGVTFWARGDAPVRVTAVMPDVVPSTEPGGLCASGCYNDHGALVSLTADWQQYTVTWGELTQEFGTMIAFDPGRVLQLQFKTAGGVDFDYWVDDLAFAQ